MENYPISINKNRQVRHFEIGEYAHHHDGKCKFRIFENGEYVASFEPDDQQFLHICQNPGKINEEILHLLAEQIEKHHPHGITDDIKKLKL